MKELDWYFDFVSGYAYLQFEMLDRLPDNVTVRCKPLLFAGLLNHFGHIGPAELAPKRQHTYRHWVWLGEQSGIPLIMPPTHPFNSLAVLRLAITLNCDRQAIRAIFRFIWQEGRDVGNPDGVSELAKRLGIADATQASSDSAVKSQLRANTDEAADRGVFGVPTSVVDGEQFWGLDTTDMLIAFLKNPDAFSAGEYRRVGDLPIGASRK
jgi:2-hydroxychromene-2-carboxylate isomerase